jgi:hypothetical protein
MLISEKHFTEKSYLKVPKYTAHHTFHPAGTARGGTAIIIKPPSNIICKAAISKTSSKQPVSVEDTDGPLTISAAYLPPKYAIEQEQLEAFYNNLGHPLIAGGDYNAKHTDWGFRLILPRGSEVPKNNGKRQPNTYPRENPHIGHPTGTNYHI